MKLSNILPSKWLQRIIIVILVVLILAATFYTIVKKRKEASLQKESGIDVSFVDSDAQTLDDIDDDNDGVPNWEEKLWGLDPNNPDTDNDGVDDATYVKNKKNIQQRRALGIENVETTLSESQKLGRSVYTALLAIEQSGGGVDQEVQEQISGNIVDYVSTLTVGEKLYLREDLVLVPNTKENSYAYQEKIEGLLETYPLDPEDIQLIIDAIDDSSPFESRITRISERYDVLVSELESMNVPFAIAGRHTEFLNSIAHISGTLKNLNQQEVDEFVSLSSVVQMEKVLGQVANAAQYMQKFFTIIADDSVFIE